MLELVEIEIQELLDEMGFENIPFIRGSALCAMEDKNEEIGKKAVEKLIETMDSRIPVPERDLDKPVYFPVENSYSIPGRGTVVTGRLERGKLKKGQSVEFLGKGKPIKSTVTGIETFHKTVEDAQAGDQLGALIRGVKRSEVGRGMIMVKPGSQQAHDAAEAQLYILSKSEGGSDQPLKKDFRAKIFSKTWDVTSEFNLQDGKEMGMPGEDCKLKLKFLEPKVLETGQKFTVRMGNVTIGTGIITNILPNLTPSEREDFTLSKKKLEKKYNITSS